MVKYDYLIIGTGLTGAVLAYELTKRNKKVLVVDKRSHIGGNCYTEVNSEILIHKYGAHIFHTDKK
jgi:UDP-galactopyranose mutase